MGYQVYEDIWHPGRWAGYGVPAVCDMPGCEEKIDHGLAYLCETHEEYDDHQDDYVKYEGCYLYFCPNHRYDVTDHVLASPKPDTLEWQWWLFVAPSWLSWREDNPEKVDEIWKNLLDSEWRPSQDNYNDLFFELKEAEADGRSA